MRRLNTLAAAAVLLAPVLAGDAAQAKTSFQYWAQGRGAYVPSKERLSTYEDDLATLGVAPPPPHAYRHRRNFEQDDLQDGSTEY